MDLELKDWLYLAGVMVAVLSMVVTLILFMIRLSADSKFARFRETVAFIEKREEKMRTSWKTIRAHLDGGSDAEEDMRVFLGQLELVSFLLQCGGFDDEIVYTYWWNYFDAPLANPQINSWIQLLQESDPAIYEHYVKQCKKWHARLDLENGRTTSIKVVQVPSAI